MFNDKLRIPLRKAEMFQPDFFTDIAGLASNFDIVHTSNAIHLFSEEQEEQQELLSITWLGWSNRAALYGDVR